jgi:signal transduction histidine kinase
MPTRTQSPYRIQLVVTAATLLVFGLIVAVITLRLRDGIQTEILRREAESMHAVALMQTNRSEAAESPLGPEAEIESLFAAVLESSRLRGVLSVTLLDKGGIVRASLPIETQFAPFQQWWRPTVSALEPVARFYASAPLERVYGLPEPSTGGGGNVPLLEIAVPLSRGDAAQELQGVAHYWVDGARLADEFNRLDRRLGWQAGIAFGAGALLVCAFLYWAFSKLEDTNRQLRARGAELARANEELSFAAKTAAIGAISAHLIHEIKNPLIGLEGFVRYGAPKPDTPGIEETWQEAAAATRRLRDLINQVISVLRDESYGGLNYKISAKEIGDTVQMRLADAVTRTGVQLVVALPETAHLSSRTANLSCLILVNLAGNALDACARGTTVEITSQVEDNQLVFLVTDHGAGLPPAVQESLFHPVASRKPSGSGIGLAISHQLAQQAGGQLELAKTGPDGTVFRLAVPLERTE